MNTLKQTTIVTLGNIQPIIIIAICIMIAPIQGSAISL